MQINFAAREINCKIVYYGPGLSGKTTNLEMIHTRIPKERRGDLTSIATEGDRTLFFDFMPLDLGKIAGMEVRFHLYTVPGQVYYNATRKLVLQGVDGIIFVADSQQGKMQENIESLHNLEENLREYGVELSSVPLVVQYNKRDLPNIIPTEELEAKLNVYNAPSFEAVAITGEGVFPTLKECASLVLKNLEKKYAARMAPAPTAQRVPQYVATPPDKKVPPPPPPPAEVAASAKPPSPPKPEPVVADTRAGSIAPSPPPIVKKQPVQAGRKKISSRVIEVPEIKKPAPTAPAVKKEVSPILLIITLIVGLLAGMAVEHFLKIFGRLLGGE